MNSTHKKNPTAYKVVGYIFIAIIIISNTPPAQYFLLPHYNYQNKDGSFQYSEEPGKGMDFQAGLIQFEGWKQQNPNHTNHTLYRTFQIRPWAFWEWWQYIANRERFLLDYRALKKSTYINFNQAQSTLQKLVKVPFNPIFANTGKEFFSILENEKLIGKWAHLYLSRPIRRQQSLR